MQQRQTQNTLPSSFTLYTGTGSGLLQLGQTIMMCRLRYAVAIVAVM
jgi:hypothetical protein